MVTYEKFQVLLDEPAENPGMGFEDYVEALAQVIRHSSPRFAVGVFAQWGGGKTTVMKAVEKRLDTDHDIIPIWFNAWRYEREEHLIIPMLDVLRETLATWSPPKGEEAVGGEKATLIRTLARSARALAAGLSIKAGLPGALEASWEATKAIDDWQRNQPDAGNGNRSDDGPQSVYHASFAALERASRDFLGDGQRRFVVFIDDLDRCLPHAALQVLESMKLFFDLRGFVFVVGLDRTVIERAVQIKYPASPETASGPGAPSYVSGTDYVKKIFQVQFNLPTLREYQLEEYVGILSRTEGLPAVQRDDLVAVVLRHLLFLTGDGTVNPREVKRLVNSYVMQMKTLERKLENAEPDVVLALQTMAFRRDWLPVYEQLESDPAGVKDLLNQAVQEGAPSFTVSSAGGSDADVHLPASLSGYLQGVGAPLFTVDLQVYLSSMEAAQFTDTRLQEARRALTLARQSIHGEEVDPAVLSTSLAPLRNVLRSYAEHPAGTRALTRLTALLDRASDSTSAPSALSTASARTDLDYLDAALRELRVGTSTGTAVA